MVDNVVEALGCCAVALGREDGGCVGVVCAGGGCSGDDTLGALPEFNSGTAGCKPGGGAMSGRLVGIGGRVGFVVVIARSRVVGPCTCFHLEPTTCHLDPLAPLGGCLDLDPLAPLAAPLAPLVASGLGARKP